MKVHTLEYIEAGVILPYNSSLTRTSQVEALTQTLYNKLSSNGWCLVLLHFLAIDTVLLLIAPPPLTFMHDENQRHGRK